VPLAAVPLIARRLAPLSAAVPLGAADVGAPADTAPPTPRAVLADDLARCLADLPSDDRARIEEALARFRTEGEATTAAVSADQAYLAVHLAAAGHLTPDAFAASHRADREAAAQRPRRRGGRAAPMLAGQLGLDFAVAGAGA
jgi:hypothetical protein